MTVYDEALGNWASLKYLLVQSITMRYNLLRHSNKSVANLFQTSLGISCDKRGSQGFKF